MQSLQASTTSGAPCGRTRRNESGLPPSPTCELNARSHGTPAARAPTRGSGAGLAQVAVALVAASPRWPGGRTTRAPGRHRSTTDVVGACDERPSCIGDDSGLIARQRPVDGAQEACDERGGLQFHQNRIRARGPLGALDGDELTIRGRGRPGMSRRAGRCAGARPGQVARRGTGAPHGAGSRGIGARRPWPQSAPRVPAAQRGHVTRGACSWAQASGTRIARGRRDRAGGRDRGDASGREDPIKASTMDARLRAGVLGMTSHGSRRHADHDRSVFTTEIRDVPLRYSSWSARVDAVRRGDCVEAAREVVVTRFSSVGFRSSMMAIAPRKPGSGAWCGTVRYSDDVDPRRWPAEVPAASRRGPAVVDGEVPWRAYGVRGAGRSAGVSPSRRSRWCAHGGGAVGVVGDDVFRGGSDRRSTRRRTYWHPHA